MNLTWLERKEWISVEKRVEDWVFCFDGDTMLIVDCLWRLVDSEALRLTSEDHGRKSYSVGNDEQIVETVLDAADELSSHLRESRIRSADMHSVAYDLSISFDNGLCLQVLRNAAGSAWWLRSPAVNIVASHYGMSLNSSGLGEIAN